jgi:hypothetical protein
MNWKRRFSSASVHEFLSPHPVRIRTWSDSVAEVATAEGTKFAQLVEETKRFQFINDQNVWQFRCIILKEIFHGAVIQQLVVLRFSLAANQVQYYTST